MTAYAADLQSVREAASRIASYARRTPVMRCSTIDELAGRRLFFKCELFQKAGSFKFRGACNAVMKLPDEKAQRGVVTHSSGNHAQALALAPNPLCEPETLLFARQSQSSFGNSPSEGQPVNIMEFVLNYSLVTSRVICFR